MNGLIDERMDGYIETDRQAGRQASRQIDRNTERYRERLSGQARETERYR